MYIILSYVGRAGNYIIINFIFLLLLSPGIVNDSFAVEKLVLNPTPSDNAIQFASLDITVNDEATPVTVTVKNLRTNNEVSMTLIQNGNTHNAKIALNNPGLVDADPDDEVIVNISTADGDVLLVTFGAESKLISVVKSGTVYPSGSRQTIDLKLYDVLGCGDDGDGDPLTPPEDDLDQDHLCDDWETGNTLRITDQAGNIYEFPCNVQSEENPHPSTCDNEIPDIFLEIDWMQGHSPDPRAIQEVVTAFANRGVNLHIQIDETHAILHDKDIPFPGFDFPSMPYYKGFDQIKGNQFGTDAEKLAHPGEWDENHPQRILKHQVFHYVFFNHQRLWNVGESGVAEINGNDFMISMGSFTGKVGSKDQQAGTLMHELGHNLGLNHGGGDTINHKPNYFSVMSYSRQFTDYDANRLLDYSEAILGHTHTLEHLKENNLVEENPDGFGLENYPGHENESIIFGCLSGAQAGLQFKPGTKVNWNCNGSIDPPFVTGNINNLPSEPSSLNNEKLDGYDDWSNLHYNFTDYSDYQDGIHENNGNGIAGGNQAREPQRGVPQGESPNSIAESARHFPPGTLRGPDHGFTFVSQVNEMTIESVTLARIAHQLALTEAILQIDEEEFDIIHISFEEPSNSKIIFVEFESPIMSMPSELLPRVDF